MIQPAASTPASMLALAIDPAVATAGESAGTADFGTLLAQTCDIGVNMPMANPESAATDAAIDPSLANLAEPATTGKELPPGLPQSLPELPSEAARAQLPAEIANASVNAELAAPTAAPETARAHLPRAEVRGPKPTRVKADPGASETAIEVLAATPAADPARPLADQPITNPLPIVLPQAGQAMASMTARAPEPSQLPSQAVQSSPVAIATSPLMAQQVAAHPAAALAMARTQSGRDQVEGDMPVQETSPAPVQPRPIAQVRLDVVAPAIPSEAKSSAPTQPITRAAKIAIQPDAISMPTAPQPQAQPAQPQPAAPMPQVRPHDFSALIDRLAAAREAVAPQSVAVSLPHTDFGHVQLRFRHEDGALAVSLASADPDFARIAAQAAPPVLPVGEARATASTDNQSAPRGDAQASGQSSGGGQRGQQTERRGDAPQRHQPQSQSHGAAGKPAQRSGIFA